MIITPRTAHNRSVYLLMSLLFAAVAGCGGSSADRGRVETIVFVSGDTGFDGISTINPDGTGRRLVFPEDSDIASPTFSPDGTKIAFLSNREDCGGGDCSGGGEFRPTHPLQIWLINADGTGLRQMTRGREGAFSPLSFSPDGSRILYNSQDRGVKSLRAVQINGGVDTVLAQGRESNVGFGTNFLHASLSPNGSKVLFVSDSDGDSNSEEWHLYVKNLDGSGETRLTSSPLNYSVYSFTPDPRSEPAPSFSPDGSRILFHRRGYLEGTLQYGLYTMKADGTGEALLTSNTGYMWASSFSPDGTRILFSAQNFTGDSDPERRLFVMNVDGTDQRPVSAGDGSGGPKFFTGNISHHGAWALTPAQ